MDAVPVGEGPQPRRRLVVLSGAAGAVSRPENVLEDPVEGQYGSQVDGFGVAGPAWAGNPVPRQQPEQVGAAVLCGPVLVEDDEASGEIRAPWRHQADQAGIPVEQID